MRTVRTIVMNTDVVVAIAAALAVSCASLAAAQSSSKARIEAFAKLPDWSGLWEPNSSSARESARA